MIKIKIKNQFIIRYLYIILFIFIYFSQISAQFLNDEFCGTAEKFNVSLSKKPWNGNNDFLKKHLKKINYYENIDKIRYRVPLKFWIYRKSDGENGVSKKKIKQFFNDLNYYNKINHTGFRYYLQEVINIDKNSKTNLGYFMEAPWQNIVNHTKGCINVYLTDSLVRRISKKRKVNIKGTYNTITKSIIIQKSTSNTSLSHEIGHYFGLFHPHRNYRAGKRHQECVSRTRKANGLFKKGLICEINGDGIADTPAEPSLSFLVDNNCKFTGTALKDRWGDNYKSKTNNIMSYPTHSKCRNNFTEGQVAVMLYNASENKYQKYWNTTRKENFIYNFDIYEPDNYKEIASTLDTNSKQKHTFHKVYTHKNSPNIQDSIDWIKFIIKEKHIDTAIININESEQNESELNIVILNNNSEIIKKETIRKNNNYSEIKLNNLKAGWYFIKIKRTIKNASLCKYTISINLTNKK